MHLNLWKFLESQSHHYNDYCYYRNVSLSRSSWHDCPYTRLDCISSASLVSLIVRMQSLLSTFHFPGREKKMKRTKNNKTTVFVQGLTYNGYVPSCPVKVLTTLFTFKTIDYFTLRLTSLFFLFASITLPLTT